MSSPVFIIGCPRSGTTLLSKMIAPVLGGEPAESHFITKYHKRLERYGSLEKYQNFKRLLQDILGERPVLQWKLTIDDPREFFETMPDHSYSSMIHRLQSMRLGKENYASWGDKSPGYTLELDIIETLFPNARYIQIVRDGRDVALSLLQRPWGPNNIFSCAVYWKTYNQKFGPIQNIKESKRLFFLKYEDLIARASDILPCIYQFLGHGDDHKDLAMLADQIRQDNFGKWVGKMSARQIRSFEREASETLKRFGYRTSYEEKPAGRLKAGFYDLHNRLGRALFLLRINTVDAVKIKFFGKEPFAE